MKTLTKVIKFTTDSLVALRGARCEKCGRVENLTIDHIVPQMWLEQFGVSRIDSFERQELLQLLCKPCNALKSCRVDWENPKTKPILLQLIAEIHP
jgi:hypothetical protein